MGRLIWSSPFWVWPSRGSGIFLWKGLVWSWAPLIRSAKIDARTTQSPANRGANPQCGGGWSRSPADAPSNAYYAAEVHSKSRPSRFKGLSIKESRPKLLREQEGV